MKDSHTVWVEIGLKQGREEDLFRWASLVVRPVVRVFLVAEGM